MGKVHSPVPGLSVVCTANGLFTLRGTRTGVATGKGTALADPRGAKDPFPWGPNSFIFMQFFGKMIG